MIYIAICTAILLKFPAAASQLVQLNSSSWTPALALAATGQGRLYLADGPGRALRAALARLGARRTQARGSDMMHICKASCSNIAHKIDMQ